ncbi:hypothetical protein C8Q80DRAFT_260802 [Daedaleopsis nitida]|nr:hypothetical protein C8Q80DRAFT_260802 [Daedaleopsis nitida]
MWADANNHPPGYRPRRATRSRPSSRRWVHLSCGHLHTHSFEAFLSGISLSRAPHPCPRFRRAPSRLHRGFECPLFWFQRFRSPHSRIPPELWLESQPGRPVFHRKDAQPLAGPSFCHRARRTAFWSNRPAQPESGKGPLRRTLLRCCCIVNDIQSSPLSVCMGNRVIRAAQLALASDDRIIEDVLGEEDEGELRGRGRGPPPLLLHLQLARACYICLS